MDFKVSYLDAGLATSYFEGDAPSPSSAGPKLNPRRYKTQLRDFLSSCRTKRKPTPNDIYADTASYAAFTSPTAPYMGGAIPSYPSAADTLYMQVGAKTCSDMSYLHLASAASPHLPE